MSDKSKIEWTDATWNPVRGCKKVSPGCDHCYAERFAERWRGIPGHPYEAGFDPRFVPDQLALPLRWQRPRMVFVNSQSDLFQGAFSNEQIASVFGVMAQCPRHTFQVLTKRGERLRKWHDWVSGDSPFDPPADFVVTTCAVNACVECDQIARPWPLPNVWQGVSIESRAYLSRMDDLRNTPAAVRFLSLEPLLGDLGTLDLSGIGWVIIGSESGPGARPMEIAWARSAVDQCVAAGVPVFIKQIASKADKKGGDPAHWPPGRWPREWPASDRRGRHANHARGERHYRYVGGRFVTSHGYIAVRVAPDHPHAWGADPRCKYAYEHILIAEEALGRSLTPNEVVHHKNEDKQDNRWPDNLEVLTVEAHRRQHIIERDRDTLGRLLPVKRPT